MSPSKNIQKVNGLYIRPGHDHDPIKPWMWADYGIGGKPVEVLSFPVPHKDAGDVIDHRATIMIRTTIGDPTTLKEVPLNMIAVFDPSRHQDFYKEKTDGN